MGLKKRLGGVPMIRRKATKPAFVETGVALEPLGTIRGGPIGHSLQKLDHLGSDHTAGRAMAGLLAVFAAFEREILREQYAPA